MNIDSADPDFLPTKMDKHDECKKYKIVIVISDSQIVSA